jgi:DNA-binding CsgD family transcriptional regulator
VDAESADRFDLADIETRARAEYLAGNRAESEELLARAHEQYLKRGDVPSAARCASWEGMLLATSGEFARAQGWFARAQRLLDEGGHDCVERGFLLIPVALRAAMSGDAPTAYDAFSRANEIGTRFGDRDLITFSRHGQGRSLIKLGRVDEGLSLLDEAMVAVTTGEVTPLIVGDVYCSVIEACHEIFDLRRAHEWTEALTRWCEAQPGLVVHRGLCLVRRAEVMQLHGAWPKAIDEAERACECLLQPPPQRAVGAAYYQRGELHRLRGELALAEESYRRASEWGRAPQPGLSRLRVAQGRLDAAVTTIRHALDESRDRPVRTRILSAYVDIMLASGDVAAARAGADELWAIAADIRAPFVKATAGYAMGTVLLAEGNAEASLAPLREAWMTWQELEAPYEAARTRVAIARAMRALGDSDTAELELSAARRVFDELGAKLDVAAVEHLGSKAARPPKSPLSEREVEVLRLVATGKTNRAIAEALRISEKTVARHVSNIFTKLSLPSRAAATAYAYEHKLVS